LRYDINQEVGQRVFLGHFEARVRLDHQGYGSQHHLKIAQRKFCTAYVNFEAYLEVRFTLPQQRFLFHNNHAKPLFHLV
jgi:hypothetical protein